jgi:transposase
LTRRVARNFFRHGITKALRGLFKMWQYASEYVPLCDDEWAVVYRLIAPHILGDPRGSGRKRKPSRPTLNAVLHVVSTGISFTALSHSVGDYPSTPTVKRFYQQLLDAQLLIQIAETLDFTRPLLLAQVTAYLRTSKMQARQNRESPGQKSGEGSWGLNLSPLPWGKPLAND